MPARAERYAAYFQILMADATPDMRQRTLSPFSRFTLRDAYFGYAFLLLTLSICCCLLFSCCRHLSLRQLFSGPLRYTQAATICYASYIRHVIDKMIASYVVHEG